MEEIANPPLPIISICLPWLSPGHPDPAGQWLQYLAPALERFIADGAVFGVFWEFGSLPQHPRSRSEEQAHAAARLLTPALLAHPR